MKTDAQAQQTRSDTDHTGGGPLSIADDRPSASVQRKLSDMANSSPQSQRHRAMAEAIQTGPVMQQRRAQPPSTARAAAPHQQPVQRQIRINDVGMATETLIGQVNGRVGGLDPLRLRSAMYQLDHDNRQFADDAALDAAVTPAVAALAANNVVGVWEPDRLEARTAVAGTNYNFNMSYKHLRDTYRRGGRGYGAQNPMGDINTILMLDDAAAMAAFEALVADVRANVLAPAQVQPHPLAQGTEHVHGGITYVIEHSPVVHVYPTLGGATRILTNNEYAALTTFARWQHVGNTERGAAVASEVAIRNHAAAISAVTGVADIPTVMTTGVRAHNAARIANDAARVTAGASAAQTRIHAARDQFAGKGGWHSDMKKNVAQQAVARAIATNGTEQGLITAEALAGLSEQVRLGTLTAALADAAVGRANAALTRLSQAALDVRDTVNTAVAEDVAAAAGGDGSDDDTGFSIFD